MYYNSWIQHKIIMKFTRIQNFSSIRNFMSSTLVFLYFFLFFYISSSRENQAICLDDLPPMIEKYNYLKDDIRPGEKFNAKKQCQQSFDKSFIPHVTKTSPFEVYLKFFNSLPWKYDFQFTLIKIEIFGLSL